MKLDIIFVESLVERPIDRWNVPVLLTETIGATVDNAASEWKHDSQWLTAGQSRYCPDSNHDTPIDIPKRNRGGI